MMEVSRQALQEISRELPVLENQAQTNLVNIIEKYKTARCTNPDCQYARESMFKGDGLLLYDCFDYHSKTDQRRPVLPRPQRSKSNVSSSAYSRNVALEILLGQKPNESSERHCLNGFEYLYHPLNYKTIECKINKTSTCNSLYCPYFHSPEEHLFFQL